MSEATRAQPPERASVGKLSAAATRRRETAGKSEEPRKTAAMIKVVLEGRQIWALLDSGTDFSLINEELANSLEKEGGRLMDQRSASSVLGASGEHIDILGCRQIGFRIQEETFTCKVTVTRGLIVDLVLGRDFVCRYRSVLADA